MPATVVDHIIPLVSRPDLRLSERNLQPLCDSHHNAEKQSEEKLGYSSRIDESGWPADPAHPFNVAHNAGKDERGPAYLEGGEDGVLCCADETHPGAHQISGGQAKKPAAQGLRGFGRNSGKGGA